MHCRQRSGSHLLRTHFVDDGVERMARAFSADGDYDVMLAIDETTGPVEARGLTKMSMTLDLMRQARPQRRVSKTAMAVRRLRLLSRLGP